MSIRRLRVPAAILALLATSLFIGEGLWATTCAPGASDGHATAWAPVDAGAPEGSDSAPTDGDETDPDGGSECPFTGVVTSAGCVSAALGTGSVELLPDAPRMTDPVASVASHLDLLLETSLLRPPRA